MQEAEIGRLSGSLSKKVFKTPSQQERLGMEAHACHPSISGKQKTGDCISGLHFGGEQNPISKTNNHSKAGWWTGSGGRAPAQVTSSEDRHTDDCPQRLQKVHLGRGLQSSERTDSAFLFPLFCCCCCPASGNLLWQPKTDVKPEVTQMLKSSDKG
jgi:hypothetical protein